MSLIKVYSHPRSGTHFLEAFVGENFYKKKDLKISPIEWGHWSNRDINVQGNPYGKLFGHHLFAGEKEKKSNNPMLYIYRDVRAVALSFWKTKNFMNKNMKNISFSDFLRLKLDWKGTPSIKSEPRYNIIEHWYYHVDSWHKLNNRNLLIIRYEDLVKSPHKIYDQILSKYFPTKYLLRKFWNKHEITRISKPIGLLPNDAKIASWKQYFIKRDEDYMYSCLPSEKYLFGDSSA